MKILIGGLFLILILFSCSHPDGQVKLLQQAQLLVENEPSRALSLLDSISIRKEWAKTVICSI